MGSKYFVRMSINTVIVIKFLVEVV